MNSEHKSVWFWRVACVAIGAAALVGAARRPEVDGTGSGRFQIYVSPLAARDTFLLDTASGDSWRITAYNPGNGAIPAVGWGRVDRLNVAAEAPGMK